MFPIPLEPLFIFDARKLYNTLRLHFFASHEIWHTLHEFTFVACITLITLSLLKIVDMLSIQTRPNAIQFLAMHRTNISPNVLQRLVYSQERCTDFKYHKINRSCLSVLYDNKTVDQRVSWNLATFYDKCKVYRFQFPALPQVYTEYRVTFAST